GTTCAARFRRASGRAQRLRPTGPPPRLGTTNSGAVPHGSRRRGRARARPPRRSPTSASRSTTICRSRVSRARSATTHVDHPRVVGLLFLHQEHVSTVLRPARFVVLPAERPLFTERDDRDAVTLDALGDQVVHRGLGAAIAKSQV